MRELDPASWYLSPAMSVIVVYVLPLVTAGGFAMLWFLRWQLARKRARDAQRAALAETQTLDEGDTILRGRVEYDGPGAVSVTIEQEATESESSGSWTVTWSEMRRRVEVAPFYVVHASGERVRVEPDRKTRLAADLVAVERVDRKHRRRIARIAEGDEVWVTGILAKEMDPKGSGGYRGGRAWIMRPRGARMLVSTRVPEAALVSDARRGRTYTLLFTLLLAVTLASHAQYHLLFATGHPATAVVTDKHAERSDDSDVFVIDYDAKDTNGVVVRDRVHVTPATFNVWNAGDTFPAFVTSDPVPLADPGDGARAILAPTIITSIAWGILVLLSFVLREKAWYDGGTVNDSASGRLPSS